MGTNEVGALKLGANGQGGPSGAIGKSDLKAPKFDKLATVLSGLFAQADHDLEEAIRALQQLKSKKKGGISKPWSGGRRRKDQ